MGTHSPLEGVNRFAADGGRLSLDVAFAVLARPQSRAVLAAVADRTDPAPVDAVVAPTDSVPVDEVVDAAVDRVDAPRRRVAAALHHVYLPKLDTAGLVVHDRETDTVAAGPHLAAVRPLLELALARGE